MPVKYSEYRLGTFLRCPRKYFYTYLTKEKKPKKSLPPPLILGNNVHETCKEFVYLRAEEQNIESLHNLFRRIWKRNNASAFFSSREEEKEFGLNGIKMLSNFYEIFGNKKPYMVEKYMERNFGSFIIFGRVDRVDMNEDGTLDIIDYKTTFFREKEGRERVRQTLQLNIYAALLHSGGKEVCRGAYYHMLESVFDEIEYNEKKIERIVLELTDLVEDVENEEEFAPRFSSDCKYCDFLKRCESEKDKAMDMYGENSLLN